MTTAEPIRIVGAREHNLRDVSLTLPHGALICFTGVSGSGKSSLAFDTLYAEGQRRYIESLSSYARQFMGELPKPDVDQITGLAPSISIQQKTTGWNPRSTVGTTTQIHDYLRVLFARAGDARCPTCDRPITAQTREQMLARILSMPPGARIVLLAPKVRGQKGEYRDLFAELVQQGFARARVDGRIIDLLDPPPLDRYRRHNIEVVIDRLVVATSARARLAEALELALKVGDGTAIVAPASPGETVEASDAPPSEYAENGGDSTEPDQAALVPPDEPGARPPARGRRGRSAKASAALKPAASTDVLLSSGYACISCGLSFEPPSPQLFSFNSPQGMCPHCDGLGTKFDFDPDLLVADPSLSFVAPCIAPLRTRPGKWRMHILEGVARHFGFDLQAPWRDLPKKARHVLLHGAGAEHITFEWKSRQGAWRHGGTWEGVLAELHEKHKAAQSAMVREYYERFMRQTTCSVCKGARLVPQALAITLSSSASLTGAVSSELNIQQVCGLSIKEVASFFDHLRVEGVKALIAAEPLKEIRARLRFLLDVGLDYLTLDRSAPSLSGGESQRIRLASQIGSGLVGVLYVLDEPSIGLHPRDNTRLLNSLKRLRDMGNTVIVVEHDRDTMEAADLIVDFGPGPGVRGGRVVAAGGLQDVAAAPDSVTGAFLSGRSDIPIPPRRRPVERPAPPGAAAPAGRKRSPNRA